MQVLMTHCGGTSDLLTGFIEARRHSEMSSQNAFSAVRSLWAGHGFTSGMIAGLFLTSEFDTIAYAPCSVPTVFPCAYTDPAAACVMHDAFAPWDPDRQWRWSGSMLQGLSVLSCPEVSRPSQHCPWMPFLIPAYTAGSLGSAQPTLDLEPVQHCCNAYYVHVLQL